MKPILKFTLDYYKDFTSTPFMLDLSFSPLWERLVLRKGVLFQSGIWWQVRGSRTPAPPLLV